MPALNIQPLIFSKDRAVQLLALLDSLRIMCLDFDTLPFCVLYKTSSNTHAQQYAIVKSLYPNVIFVSEDNLEKNTIAILQSSDFILFLVDDCIAIKPFEVEYSTDVLAENEDCLGVSLRLGQNTSYCYPHSCFQKIPDFTSMQSNVLKFDWTTSEYDFGYPLELSSSIYRTKDILPSIQSFHFSTVNDLESKLDTIKDKYRKLRPNLVCYKTSRAFCNPLNIVGSVETNKNRKSEKKDYAIECLCAKFENGWKINVESFFKEFVIGCHQEAALNWMKRV